MVPWHHCRPSIAISCVDTDISGMNEGGQQQDGVMAASLAVPCPLMRWQQWQRRKQWSTMTTVAAVRTTMPWHHWLFLILSCNGNHSSGVNYGAQQQKAETAWKMVARHCLPFLTLFAMAIMTVAGMMVWDNDGGGGMDNGALTSSAIPSLLV